MSVLAPPPLPLLCDNNKKQKCEQLKQISQLHRTLLHYVLSGTAASRPPCRVVKRYLLQCAPPPSTVALVLVLEICSDQHLFYFTKIECASMLGSIVVPQIEAPLQSSQAMVNCI